MIPSLAPRGKLVLASAALFILIGAFHGAPPLVAMGGGVLIALLAAHLGFYPIAILLRRRKIELSWWVSAGAGAPRTLVPDRELAVHVAYRNHGTRTLRILRTEIVAGRGLAPLPSPAAAVPAGTEVEYRLDVATVAAGHHMMHGATLVVGDGLGLFELRAYFPNPIGVTVFPRPRPASSEALRVASGGASEHAGRHVVRRRGLAGELRELRDHAHGDPFKYVAWKATARRRKLMVRDLETHRIATHMLCVDVGASMRRGPAGHTSLDWAIDLAAGIARAAFAAGDRVGLVSFDTRPVVRLRPGSGPHHGLQLTDGLLENWSLVDDDLTDVTDGELAAIVASYLAHHEGVDVRVAVPPSLDDPRWNQLQAGPDGALYDLAAIHQRIAPGAAARARAWSFQARDQTVADPQLEPLRRYCRERGLPLPYRRITTNGQRSAGFAQALEAAVTDQRPDRLIILSDLAGVAEDEARVSRALTRARHHAGSIIAWLPPSFRADTHDELDGRRLAGSSVRSDRIRSSSHARELLRGLGIRTQIGRTEA